MESPAPRPVSPVDALARPAPRRRMACALVTAGTMLAAPTHGELPPAPAAAPAAIEAVVVTAPQPRYVAPTLRDQIGRIWAPVRINGAGPFRLVLDTGASRSAVVARVAAALALPPAPRDRARVKGVTGTMEVPVVTADTLEVGDLLATNEPLLVIADAFGDADGVLAARTLGDRRILVEFRRDRIEIAYPPRRYPTGGFARAPIRLLPDGVPYVVVRVGGVRTKAVIDTGAQHTAGNAALRAALERRRRSSTTVPEQLEGVSGDLQAGDRMVVPPIGFGGVTIRESQITFGDFFIFDEWDLADEPALLVGMDLWGLVDTLIIDYRRRELLLRLRAPE